MRTLRKDHSPFISPRIWGHVVAIPVCALCSLQHGVKYSWHSLGHLFNKHSLSTLAVPGAVTTTAGTSERGARPCPHGAFGLWGWQAFKRAGIYLNATSGVWYHAEGQGADSGVQAGSCQDTIGKA